MCRLARIPPPFLKKIGRTEGTEFRSEFTEPITLACSGPAVACSETSVAGLLARGEIAWLTLTVNDPAQNQPPPTRRSAGLMVV